MMDSYDLFSAMSGVDEALIARSDFRVKRHKHRLFPALTAAACATIILVSIFFLFRSPAPQTLQEPSLLVPSETESIGTTMPTTDRPLQLDGSDIGTLHIIRLSQDAETSTMPDFLMYVNPQRYRIAEGGGVYYISPVSSTEHMPDCLMTITWQPDTTLEAAIQQQSSALAATMTAVGNSPTDLLPGGILIYGSGGSEWDAEQTEVYLTNDGQDGVFCFTLSYYLQDTDSHAIWFRDMLQTFEIVMPDTESPEWFLTLQTTVDSFTAGFLKNDFTGLQDLIADDAEIDTYDSNVLAQTRILQTHYKVDHDPMPTSAEVTVRHKYLEQDAYDYITIELKYQDGRWQVAWAMIER